MGRIKKVLAIVLSLVMIVTVAPAVKKANGVKADNEFCITSPVENQLMAAGHFDIKWTEAASEVKDYKLYIDNELITTTTDTTYEYYTTKVKMFTAYVEAIYDDGSTQKTDEISFAVTKKGLAVNDTMGKKLDPLEMSMGWYYTWGTSPFSYTTYKYAEFVPMKWGAGNEDTVLNEIARKNYMYLLAYNEPDYPNDYGGSNVPVQTAIDNWSKFPGKSRYLGAPAPALSPSWDSGTWFRTFMDNVDHNTIDFIPLHCYYKYYGGVEGARAFLKEVVDKTYEMYHKPIWITEFAVSGWGYNNEWARQSVQEFMYEVIDGLNERDYVERYSWFSFNTTDDSNGASALWTNATGELTDLGRIYAYYGNPEGYVPSLSTLPQAEYTVTTTRRNDAYNDSIKLKGVTCQNYIKSNGVTVEASSVLGNHLAEKAIDGDIKNDSRWESKHGVDPQTFTINLGMVRNIKQVNILWENAGAKDYTIEVSTDGINYTKVAEASGIGAMQNRDDTIVLSKLTSAQYIRITGTQRATGYGYSIWELAVYGTDDSKVDETTTAEPTTRPVVTRPNDFPTANEPITKPNTPTTTKDLNTPAETKDSNMQEGTTTGNAVDTTKNISETTVSLAAEESGEGKAPGKAKVKKITAKKKSSQKVKLSLKKISGAKGYQVAIYKTKKNAKKDKKAIVKKFVKKTSTTIKNKKLKNKKTLYVKVRAYNLNGKRKIYGKWSAIKKVRIKK